MKITVRKTFLLLAYMLLAVSCYDDDLTKVNLKWDLRHKVSSDQLYSGVDIVPVFAKSEELACGGKPFIWVSGDNLYILSSDSLNISAFDTSGVFKWVFKGNSTILDFSTYKDSLMMILYGDNYVEEYSISGRQKLLEETNPNIKSRIKHIMRNKDDVYWYFGCTLKYLYDGCCYKEGKLSDGGRNPIACSDDVKENRYCRCDSVMYYNYYTNGMVLSFSEDDYIFPLIEWDFGKYTYDRKAVKDGKAQLSDFATSFSNLQVCGIHNYINPLGDVLGRDYYLKFKWDGRDLLLIYDLENHKSRILEKTAEGFVFPLGIIDNGINYFACKPEELGKYMDVTKLDTSDFEGADCLLLKYHLL